MEEIEKPANPSPAPSKKKRPLYRRILRAFRNVFLGLIIFIVVLFGVLQIPAVQTWMGRQASSFLKKKFDVDIRIEKVRFTLPNSLQLKGVLAMDHRGDTLIYAGKLKVSIGSILPSSGKISMHKVVLEDGYLNMIMYEDDAKNNLSILLDKFKPKNPKPKTGKKRMVISVDEIVLENSRVNVINRKSKPPPAQFESNNIRITGVNGTVKNFQVASDSISFITEGLSGREFSGLHLKELNSQVLICNKRLSFTAMDLYTDYSHLSGFYAMEYNSFLDFSDFIDKVNLRAELEMSDVDMKDVAYFAQSLEGIDFNLRFRGKVNGPVSKLAGENIRIYFGTVSQFNGQFLLEGLPDIESTHIDFHLQKLATNYYDLGTIPVPPFSEGKKLEMPAEIIRMGVLNFDGDFEGYISDFVANGNLVTNAGGVRTTVHVVNDKKSGELRFNGDAIVNQFNIGRVIGNEELLGEVSLASDTLSGVLKNGKISGKFDGKISQAVFKGYTYTDINADLDYSSTSIDGEILITDPNGVVDFSGLVDFEDKKQPYFDVEATVTNLNLTKTNLVPSDTTRIVSGYINANFSGLQPDDILGHIIVKNARYTQAGKSISMKSFELDAMEFSSKKIFEVQSDFVYADFNGRFNFVSLVGETVTRVNEVLPLLRLKVPKGYKPDTNDFYYDIDFKDVNPLTEMFFPALKIAPGGKLQGHYRTTENDLLFEGGFDYVKYNQLRFDDFTIQSNNQRGYFNLDLSASRFFITDSLHIDNLSLDTRALGDTVGLTLHFKNKTSMRNEGYIDLETYLGNRDNFDVNLDSAAFYFNDSLWRLEDENEVISIDTNRILIQDLAIYQGNTTRKLFGVDGEVSADPDYPLRVKFTDFPMLFFNSFLKQSNAKLGGVADGTIELYNLLKQPYFTADIDVLDLALNDTWLGDLNVYSEYNTKTGEIFVNNTYLRRDQKKILEVATGRFNPNAKGDQLDIPVTLSGIPFVMVEPFLAPDLSELEGEISGNINIGGKASAPEFDANISGKELALRVGFTKTKYKIDFAEGSGFAVNNKEIRIPTLTLKDEEGGIATLQGNITHDVFKDIYLDLHFDRIDNLMALNTTRKDNSQFYGTAIISGIFNKNTLNVIGPLSDLKITGGVKTMKGTVINIPLDNASRTSAAEFVTFINSKADTLDMNGMVDSVELKVNYDVNVQASVDEGATFRLIFDETLGDVITASGTGDFQVLMNSSGRFDLIGQYVITKGDYMFSLQGLANKKFTVKPGSTVNWNGKVEDANLNVTAVYTTNASVAPILATLDPLNAEDYRARQRVNCELLLKGNLDNPQISFDLDLPNADENQRSLLLSALNTKEEKERQVFALLILNQFLPPESLTGTGGSSASTVLSNTASSTSLELVTTQLNAWISKVNQDFNLKLDYQQATNADETGRTTVGFNYQFVDGRIIIDTDLGVSGKQNSAEGNSSSNVVGNFNIEFKITKDGKLRLKAFNRSNENNLLKNSIPYTQGASISFRQEFNTWADLKKKKEKKPKKDDTNNNTPANPSKEEEEKPQE